MATINLPHFGHLDPQVLDQYYDVEISFGGREIMIDLNFIDNSIDIKLMETVKGFLENLRIYDLNNKRYIENDFNDEDGDTVMLYLKKHLHELGNAELSGLINTGTKSIEHEKQLLKKLQLVRVGIYPATENPFAVFDYSIGKAYTDDVIAINTDENGNLNYMSVEN